MKPLITTTVTSLTVNNYYMQTVLYKSESKDASETFQVLYQARETVFHRDIGTP